MKTLKEAHATGIGEAWTVAGEYAHRKVVERIISAYLASLESNGYCIVPMEATEEMAKASCELDCTRQECARSGRCRAYPEKLNAKREHWNDMLAARPKIED
jgi:hypothetical protein